MSARTDLALEAKELREAAEQPLPAGVRCTERREKGVRITRVEIRSAAGAEALGKPCGTYITLDFGADQLRTAPGDCEDVLTEALEELLPAEGSCLVVGLGNEAVTPDAVGPVTARRVLVTRHLREVLPDLFGPLRQVSAVSPGVLGDTGVESAEVVAGLAERIRPGCVLAVDALAAARPERLCRSVQLADTGIIPGAGVGNDRRALNRETLGVPVLAVGVPTVCDLRSLVETEAALIVTPGKIDAEICVVGHLLGAAINRALHPSIPPEDLAEFAALGG